MKIKPLSAEGLCGCALLYEVGDSKDDDYRALLPRPESFHIASVTQNQTAAIKRLKDWGFKQVTDWDMNPKSGNPIAVFVRTLEPAGEAEIRGAPESRF